MIIESQPVWQRIHLLTDRSRFARVPLDSPECRLEGEKERYFIEKVRDNSDGTISKIHKLLEQNFDAKEVDSEEDMIERFEKGATEGRKYKYTAFIVRDEPGNMAGVFMGVHLELMKADNSLTDETMLFRGYTTIKGNFQRYGFARELYCSALIAASREAENWGKKLTLAISEAVFSAEKPWNNLGLKRVYAKVNDTNVFEEVPYLQPPYKFDPRTGDIAEDAGIVPEHLMVQKFGSILLNHDRLSQAVRTSYRKIYFNPQRNFQNEKAYLKHMQYATQEEASFEKFLSEHGQLIFLTAEDREKARSMGLVIHEFKEADQRS